MKRWIFLTVALWVSILLPAAAVPVVLYDNTGPGSFIKKPPGPNATSYQGTRQVTNSFTLASASRVEVVQYDSWQAGLGNRVATVEYRFGTTAFGTDLGTGWVAPPTTDALLGTYAGFVDVTRNTFSVTPVDLGPGTYWLTLTSGSTTKADGSFVLWDMSSGPSTAFWLNTWVTNIPVPQPSNTFKILGTSAAAVPEIDASSATIPLALIVMVGCLLGDARRRTA